MNSLYNILKIKFINNTGINKLLKGEKKNPFIGVLIAGLLGVLIVGGVSAYLYGISEVLTQIGLMDLFLYLIPVLCVILCLSTSIYKAQGVLFSSKDTELLASMPIKESTILSSKIIELLFLNYAFLLAIIVPAGIIYYLRIGNNPLIFIYLILGFIFIPLLPILIASIISIGLSYITSRFKYRNLVLILLNFLVIFLVFFGVSKIQSSPEFSSANVDGIINLIKKVCPPSYYFSDALVTLNINSLGMLILWSVIPFAIFVIVFKRVYKNITSKLNESYGNNKLKKIDMKASSQVMAIFKKEVRRYFATPIYVLNTAFGVIIMTVASIATVVGGEEQLLSILELPQAKEIIPLTAIVILLFSACLTSTTSSSISIEGKNLWVIKTLPIKEMDIFWGKILLNLVLFVPFIILNSLILKFALGLSIEILFFSVVIPTLAVALTSIGGLMINLLLPKLEWVNETQVVKQSSACFASIILGLAVAAIPIGLLIVLPSISIRLLLASYMILLLILNVVLYQVLKVKGTKIFRRL